MILKLFCLATLRIPNDCRDAYTHALSQHVSDKRRYQSRLELDIWQSDHRRRYVILIHTGRGEHRSSSIGCKNL